MSTRRSSFRKREKPPCERIKDHCRNFTAFLFSNVGIILLVILYTIGGAFIFPAIEIAQHENDKQNKTVKDEVLNVTECLELIWRETSHNHGIYDAHSYKERVNDILLKFQRSIYNNHIVGQDIYKQWSFSGAFLYSLTVITTIGYGNISPRSDWGKIVTIVYAIVGMPLFLLYLSNIGDVLAKSFKWIYSKVCLCRICPGVAKRRMIRERRKLKQLVMSKALADMEDARRSKYSSYTSSSSSTSDSATSYYTEETESSSTSSRNRNGHGDSGGIGMAALELYEDDDDTDIERDIRGSTDEITVPLTVCIFIMISYILGGALLFQQWEEEWGALNGSYFCFISLSSIGFGDFVPGDHVITNDKDKVEVSFILCAVYLLLGMALIAMCFNLMQEQVIHNIRAFKKGFKACFRCKKR